MQKHHFQNNLLSVWNFYTFAINVQMQKVVRPRLTQRITYIAIRCIFISMVSLIMDDSCVNAKLVFLHLLPIHKSSDVVIIQVSDIPKETLNLLRAILRPCNNLLVDNNLICLFLLFVSQGHYVRNKHAIINLQWLVMTIYIKKVGKNRSFEAHSWNIITLNVCSLNL